MTLLALSLGFFACNNAIEVSNKLVSLPTKEGPLVIKASLIQFIETITVEDEKRHFIETSKRAWEVSCSPEECLEIIGEKQ